MFVYCRALLVPPLYVCFVGRETLCCLCLNKRFCIVLYWCPVTLKIISVSQASFIIEFSIMSDLCIACNKLRLSENASTALPATSVTDGSIAYVIQVINFVYISLLLNLRFIRKTCPCNVYPLKPHFYRKAGVCRDIPNFLIFDPKHTLWVLVRTASAKRL